MAFIAAQPVLAPAAPPSYGWRRHTPPGPLVRLPRRQRFFPLVLCTLLSFSTGVAVADGPYVSAGAGAALVPGITATPHDLGEAIDAAVETSGKADEGSAEVTIGFQPEGEADWAFDVGFVAGGALGYDFGAARIDVEFSYLTANFEFASEGENTTESAGDTFTALSLLATGWYDLEVGSFLTPYLGVGVGATNLQIKLTRFAAELAAGDEPWFEGAGWGFAYQAGVGVAFRVVAGISLDLGYRIFGTLATEVSDHGADRSSVSPAVMAHRIQLGVRFPT